MGYYWPRSSTSTWIPKLNLNLKVRDKAVHDYRIFFLIESRFRSGSFTFINGRTTAILYPEHQYIMHIANDQTTSRLKGVAIGERSRFLVSSLSKEDMEVFWVIGSEWAFCWHGIIVQTFPVRRHWLLRMNRELRDYVRGSTMPKKCHE
ncbi:hypothetical protein ColLi_01008 [Colletotrichum liriopes]|uniref:Uncharacterized protein n=1 Tax=Colletotrichum liriopes TaxID=708192 RepID=A0AA37GC55_9PEZI|nr:hypothetical protein ColLi_01008 [Colletotrichum liriopes]